MGLIRTFVIFFLLLAAIRFVRLLFAVYFKGGSSGPAQPPHGQQRSRRVGETTVSYRPGSARHTREDTDDGEYIDYKEVK